MKNIILLICIIISLGLYLSESKSFQEGGSKMTKEIMGAIDVMAYGYNVKIFINGVDIGIGGGKSESARLFGKEHSMVSRLPEDMKHLACLQAGQNEIKVDYQSLKDVDSTGLTVELRSAEQFTTDEHLFYFREEPDKNGGQRSFIESFNM